jgi:hypothetical protein
MACVHLVYHNYQDLVDSNSVRQQYQNQLAASLILLVEVV